MSAPKPPAEAQPDPSFAEWLATEMPAGTVIGDPAWWANRIARQYAKRRSLAETQAQGGGEVVAWHIEHPDGFVSLRKLDSVDSHMREQAAADGIRIRSLAFADTAPPSAPVGVEVMDRAMDAYRAACAEWRKNPDNRDEPEAMFGVRSVVEALAQQPAAVTQPGAGEVSNGSGQPAAVDGDESDEEPAEPCESALPDCGPAVAWDSEGIGACERCAKELGWVAAQPGGGHG